MFAFIRNYLATRKQARADAWKRYRESAGWFFGCVMLCLSCHSSDTPLREYSVIGTVPGAVSLATLFAVQSYELNKVPYKKTNAAILFKSPVNFKKEGITVLDLGDVALFSNNSICVLRGTKQSFVAIESLIVQCLDRILFGTVSPNEFIVDKSKWYLYQRDSVRHELQNDNIGVSFEFPVSTLPDPNASPPWNGYFVYGGKSIPSSAKNLILEFKIVATPGVEWNYKSESINTGCDYAKPSLRVYIAKGPIYAADESHRWWYTSGFILRDTPDVVKFSVPLDGVGWSGIFAGQAIDNLPAFRETVTGSDWVGITFGGGCNYSHGVNVSNGVAKFNLQRMYCE